MGSKDNNFEDGCLARLMPIWRGPPWWQHEELLTLLMPESSIDSFLFLAERLLVEAEVFRQQTGVVAGFLELLQGDGVHTHNLADPLDVSIVGAVETALGVDDGLSPVLQTDSFDCVVQGRCSERRGGKRLRRFQW